MNTLLQIFMNFQGPWPYALVFGLLLFCGLGVPLPEDIVLFAAGMMSYYGTSDVWMMIVISFFGVMVGDGIVFTLGHKYGKRLLQTKLVSKLLPEKRMQLVQKKLHEQGNKVIFAARFMPGLRAPIFFSAGMLHLPYRIFVFYDGLAATLSVPLIVYSVYYFGDKVDYVIKVIKRVQFGIVGLIFSIILIIALKIYLNRRKERKNDAA